MDRFILILAGITYGFSHGMIIGGATHTFFNTGEKASICGGALAGIIIGALLGNYIWLRKSRRGTSEQ